MRLDPITLIAEIQFSSQGEDSSYVVLPNILGMKPCDAIKIEQADSYTLQIVNLLGLLTKAANQPVKPDDHSELVPLLPIPNRTVK